MALALDLTVSDPAKLIRNNVRSINSLYLKLQRHLVKVDFPDGSVTYQSNPKHTSGYGGSRPGHLASVEPANSLDLFRNSVVSKAGTRIAYDRSTNTVHQFFSDSNGNVYHWAGTLDRSRINKLNISVRRELGIPGK